MKSLEEKALADLIQRHEADRVEFKEAWKNAFDAGAQAVCAFANDLPGCGEPGIFVVGLDDSGNPVGLTVSDELLRNLGELKASGQIVPSPSILVEKRQFKGADIAVVTVWPSDTPPVRFQGRTWVRIGPRRGQASLQDERILNERRRHRDVPFDVRPQEQCPFSELNRVEFESAYLPSAYAPDVIAANQRSYEERLAACRMVSTAEEPTPTVLGIVAIGITPRTWVPCNYIQFLRIGGVDLTDPIEDAEDVDGSLATMLRRLDDKVKAHITAKIEITVGETEKRTYNYPLAALQQLVRNAVMHRTYENTNAPIRINWFNNRIEIHSPGGPYGQVTAENFGSPGITDYRNPHIAEAMKVFGYVQRFGVGIATAQKALADNGNPPAKFIVEPNYVLVTLERAP